MLRTHEATLDPKGTVKFKEKIKIQKPQKILVVFLDDLSHHVTDTAFSEKALAKDWLGPEEDKAWAHLQKVQ